MAEVNRPARYETAPRKNPKTVCPVCGGRVIVNGKSKRDGYVMRWLKCKNPACSYRDFEHD